MPPSGHRLRLLLLFIASAVALSARAVEFDERQRAPSAVSTDELRSRLARVGASFSATDAPSALARVRSASAAREHFDATWLLGRSVDARQPVPELEALGFRPHGEGGYSIDTLEHPEWRPLAESLWRVVKPDFIEILAPALSARGFRAEDLEALRGYVTAHDLERARSRVKLDLAISASRVARKLQRLKRPVDTHFMWSYFYQRSAGIAEVERQWAQGLLDALDPRAQRILASYLAEGAGTWTILPTVDDAALESERELLLKPDFEQMARKAFEEGQL